MYLPERLKTVPMKSLYYGVLLAMVTTLSLSFFVFQSISNRIQKRSIDPAFDRIDEFELASAGEAVRNGGTKALGDYLKTLDRVFSGASHYLLDSRGFDLVSGENRAALLPPAPRTRWRTRANGHYIRAHQSADGKYWIVAVGLVIEPHIWEFLPFYFLVIGVSGVLCWLASVGVVSPIRRIAPPLRSSARASSPRACRRCDRMKLGNSVVPSIKWQRLERLIVSERRLLGDISHELRSPLARLKFAIKLANLGGQQSGTGSH